MIDENKKDSSGTQESPWSHRRATFWKLFFITSSRRLRVRLMLFLWTRGSLQIEWYQDCKFCQADFCLSKCQIHNAIVWRDTISWGSLGTAKCEGSVPIPLPPNLSASLHKWFAYLSLFPSGNSNILNLFWKQVIFVLVLWSIFDILLQKSL